jgi:S-DNA-T family DNA segregation ATPase FtsK/SpoIIIE
LARPISISVTEAGYRLYAAAMSYGWRTIDTEMVELCDECGYDARLSRDEAAELAAAYAELARLVDGHPDADRRPEPETFSAREYVGHCVEVSQGLLEYVARVIGRDQPGELDHLAGAAESAAAVVPTLTAEDRAGVLEDEYPMPVTVEWIVRHLVHDLEHHVLDIRRGYARLAMADHPEVYTVER